MSKINLSNSQLVSNFIRAKIKEGNGTFSKKEVILFKDETTGTEFTLNDKLIVEFKDKIQLSEDIKAPKNEEVVEEATKEDIITNEVLEVKVEEFKCDECGTTSKTKAGLAAHKRSHK